MSISNASALSLNGKTLQSLSLGGRVIWSAPTGNTLLSRAVGSEVHIEETVGIYAPYIVIAHGHHGDGLTTLIRKYALSDSTKFHYTSYAEGEDYKNKYDGSELELFLTKAFNATPAVTKERIASVAVPTRSSAMGSYTIVGVDSRLFPLSEMEFFGSGYAEGSHIPYFDSTEKRIAYTADGTAQKSWTRTVAGGMPNFARQISTSGSISSQYATGSVHVRPACCVKSDTPIILKDGKYVFVQTYTNLVPISTDTDGSIYNGTGYKDDARLSSSGSVSGSAQSGSVVTGFMPWKSRGIIRIKGGTFPKNDSGHYYIHFYNASKTYIYGGDDNSYAQTSGAFSKMVHTYDEATGVSTLDFSGMDAGTAIGDAAINGAYFRMNVKGTGANLIITVNEEIT